MKRKIFIGILIIALISICLFYIFSKNNYKTLEFGNTNNKSIKDYEEYILNLESYQAQIEVQINSNKTQNKYEMKQTYISQNQAKQEIIEPQNMRRNLLKL